MLRKISVSVLALAIAGYAGSAMAVNPWAPAQTTVPITVTVQQMTELWTDVTPVSLQIVDAGDNGGSANAVARSVAHLSNVNIDVSVSIDDDIPTNTSFWVLINPAASWATIGASGASNTIEWRRDGASYTGNTVNASVPAFSALANPGSNASSPGIYVPVQYYASAWNFMPATQTEGFNVVWTVAANP